jgi:hypothetical protein
VTLREISDSEFWLEGPYGFLTARFFVDVDAREISYDIFSPKCDLHLKEESLRDVEKLERIMEEKGEWNYEKPIEELRLILDCARLQHQRKTHNLATCANQLVSASSNSSTTREMFKVKRFHSMLVCSTLIFELNESYLGKS